MTKKIKGYHKTPDHATEQGERFNMDYGFVRGKTTIKNESSTLITSKDGFNCYLLVVDEFLGTYGYFYPPTKLHPSTPSHPSSPTMATHLDYDVSAYNKGRNWQRV